MFGEYGQQATRHCPGCGRSGRVKEDALERVRGALRDEILRSAVGDHAAFGEDDDAVEPALGGEDVVRRDEDTRAHRTQRVEQAPNDDDGSRVETAERLVEDQEPRHVLDRRGDLQFLLRAVRHVTNELFEVRCEAQFVDQDVPPIISATSPQPLEMIEVLPPGERQWYRKLIRHETELIFCPTLVDVVPTDGESFGFDPVQPDDAVYEGRLPAAVGAEHRDELAGIDGEVDPGERAGAGPVTLRAAERDEWLRCRHVDYLMQENFTVALTEPCQVTLATAWKAR